MSYKRASLIATFLYCATPCLLYAHPILDVNPTTESSKNAVAALKKGDGFAEADLYRQASANYLDALQTLATLPESDRNAIDANILETYGKYQLAQAYVRDGNSIAALPILQDIATQDPTAHPRSQPWYDSLYLLGLTSKNLGKFPEAKRSLDRYLAETPPQELTYGDEAHFQLGLVEFLGGNYDNAEKAWQTSLAAKNGNIATLAQLYLARIDVLKHQEQRALERLNKILSEKNRDFITYEARYLMGKAYYSLGDYPQALNSFEKSLPEEHPENYSWYGDTLEHLGNVHLTLGLHADTPEIDQQNHLLQAKVSFERLLSHHSNEHNTLELGKVLSILAQKFPQEEFYLQARGLLVDAPLIATPTGRSQALMLIAQAAPTFNERDALFITLIAESKDPESAANAWYIKGKNDYDEGMQHLHEGEATALFTKASDEFSRAASLYPQTQDPRIADAKKYRALSLMHLHDRQADGLALALIEEASNTAPNSKQDRAERLYLEGLIASRLIAEPHDAYYTQAVAALTKAGENTDTPYSDMSLKHLGALFYRVGDFTQAEKTYLQLAQDHPQSLLCGEGWYWAANCAIQQKKDSQIARDRKKNVYELYPDSPYAAEAYISMYSTREYLQGDRATIKHLQNFIGKFPDSPRQIEANYLLGMDLKRDRKTAEGKWIRKRNLMEAIDAFQESENQFAKFSEKGELEGENLEYFTKVRYQATLERALANLAVANESLGAKKKIYLEYAEEVFKTLNKDLDDTQNPYAKILQQKDALSPVYEETLFGLAQTKIKAGRDDDAAKVLRNLLEKYDDTHTTQGYYLSRLWYELGMISLRKNQPQEALLSLQKAEEASKGDLISTDQKLDLWIQQALSYRTLGDFDHSILLLSKTINDDAVSSLRLKAMFLRAETYEQQGRHELARKQLESLAKKGGYWGKEAKQKMEAVHKPEVNHVQ